MRHFSDCAPTTQFGSDGPAISNGREKKLRTEAAGICFRGLSSSGNYNVERVCEAKAAIAFVSLSKDPQYARASHVQARYVRVRALSVLCVVQATHVCCLYSWCHRLTDDVLAWRSGQSSWMLLIAHRGHSADVSGRFEFRDKD